MLKPLALAAVALGLIGSAHAHDYSADMICRVTETDGARSAWSFAPNTIGADGRPCRRSSKRPTSDTASPLSAKPVRARLGDDREPGRRRDLASAE